MWYNSPHYQILQDNLLQGICAEESSGILRNATKQVSEKCKAKLIQEGRKMEISGSTYPHTTTKILEASHSRDPDSSGEICSTPAVWAASLIKLKPYISQCSQWTHWLCLWMKIRTQNFSANYHQKTNPKLTVPHWKNLNIVNIKTIFTSLLYTQLCFLSTEVQIHYLTIATKPPKRKALMSHFIIMMLCGHKMF